MEKKKNVTIPEELFIDLVKYFLADIRWDEDRIRSGLQEKLEAMVKRELYTRYKTAGTPEEREKARLQKLDLLYFTFTGKTSFKLRSKQLPLW